jgi:putative hydrolase of the HAD superfamily
MPSGIRAVIFDYGNVLCEPQPPEDITAMATELAQTIDRFVPIYWRNRVSYDRADMDAVEYWALLAGRRLALDKIAKLIDLDNRSWLHPRASTIPWVDAMRRQGLRTALLSNLPASLRDALGNVPWLPEFDVKTYSCTVRLTKPDREIYEHCVRALGVDPSEAVFLDDRPENVEAAAAMGIHAILFETPAGAAIRLASEYRLTV